MIRSLILLDSDRGGELKVELASSCRVLTHAGSNTQNFAVVWVAPPRNFAVIVAPNQGGDKVEAACDQTASALIHYCPKSR